MGIEADTPVAVGFAALRSARIEKRWFAQVESRRLAQGFEVVGLAESVDEQAGASDRGGVPLARITSSPHVLTNQTGAQRTREAKGPR